MIKKTYIPAKPRSSKLVGTSMGGGVAGSVSSSSAGSHSHSNKLVLDKLTDGDIDVLGKLSVDEDGNVKVDTTLWATGGISALGLGEGGGGGGDGGADMLDSWTNYTEAKANYYAPASLLVPFRDDTLSRLASLEAGGGAIDIEILVTGAGNAVTGVSMLDKTLTFTKGSTFSLSSHTHPIAQVTDLQTALNGKEPSFTKNTAFNKNFGAVEGTVAEGNDSRINNGQTAFDWGNHSSAGYALNSALITHINKVDNPHAVTKSQVGLENVDNTSDANKPVSTATQNALDGKLNLTGGTLTGNVTAPTFIGALSGNASSATNLSRSVLAGDGLTGGGKLDADRTLTLGTPGTLSRATTNKVEASSHTHAITTTSVGAVNTIMQTNASGGTKLSNLMINNWSLLTETSDTSFVIKYGDANKMKIATSGLGVVNFYGNLFIQDNLTAGDIISENDITAYEVKAYETVITPQVELGANWKLEQVGTELVFKYNNVIKQRMLSDGTILAVGGITALSTE